MMQQTVDDALKNAIENGYRVYEWTDEAIAIDLNRFDSECEKIPHKTLLSLVSIWKDKVYGTLRRHL